MAAVRHFELAKFWYFIKQPTLEAQSASAYQISLKSNEINAPTVRGGDIIILGRIVINYN